MSSLEDKMNANHEFTKTLPLKELPDFLKALTAKLLPIVRGKKSKGVVINKKLGYYILGFETRCKRKCKCKKEPHERYARFGMSFTEKEVKKQTKEEAIDKAQEYFNNMKKALKDLPSECEFNRKKK